jgi:oligopeptide transport system permease protein
MINYIVRRIVASIVTLWIVITATFFLMHAIPGGPFDGEKKLPPAILSNLEHKYGLDKPLFEQYGMYMNNLIHGDLGPTLRYEGMTVNDVVKQSFPASAKIGLVSVIFSVVIGVWLGVAAALRQGKWQDQLIMLISIVGYTVPSYVMATLLIYVFAVKLQLLPPTGFDGPANYIMPAIALGGFYVAVVARLTRSTLLDVIRQDYIRTAKAKGLPRSITIYKHALRNALIPVVTYLGPLISGILTGSFVVETIFGIPGIGREFVQAAGNRDYMMIVGLTIFDSALLIMFNFIVDMLYGVIDPRIKLEG